MKRYLTDLFLVKEGICIVEARHKDTNELIGVEGYYNEAEDILSFELPREYVVVAYGQ